MPDANQAHTPRRPDAIRCPRDYPRNYRVGRDVVDRDVARKLVFGPVLGCKRVWSRELVDRANESFISASPADTMLYPMGHPDEKQDRYDWFVAERGSDGSFAPVAEESGHPAEAGRIKLGYLKPDPYAEDETVKADMATAYEAKLAEVSTSPEHIAKLRMLGVLPPEADPENAEAAPSPALASDRPSGPSRQPVPEPGTLEHSE